MKALILFTTAFIASAALAQQQAAPQLQPPPRRSLPDRRNVGLDPNEMICRSQQVLGSRLAVRRICATRRQWLEQSRTDRLLTARTTRTWCGRDACPE